MHLWSVNAAEMEEPNPFLKRRAFARLATTVVILLLFQWGLTVLNDDVPLSLWAWLALIGHLIFSYRFASDAPASFIMLLPLFLINTTEVVSCAAIESGAWMEEIAQAGSSTGGTARLAITLMSFFSVAALIVEPAWKSYGARSLGEQFDQIGNRLAIPVTLACMIFFGYLTFIGLRHGFPILTGTDRFDFSHHLSDRIFVSLLGNCTLFATVLSLMTVVPRTRFLALVLFLGIILFEILFGEKFTMLIVTSAVFCSAGMLDYLSHHQRLPMARIISIGVAMGVATMVTSLNYYYSMDKSLDVAKTKLLARMAEQGEMWFVGDRDFRYKTNIEWSVVSQDVMTCLGWRSQDPANIHTEFGAPLVMDHYGNASQRRVALEKHVYFAFTYSTYWMMVAGYPGFAVVSFLTSVAYGIAARMFLIGLVRRNIIVALLSQKAMLWVYSAVVVGWTFLALGYKTALVLCAAWLACHWNELWHHDDQPVC